MSKREDIHRIMIIGSGPIVIGQACEFDYSGTQGCKALRADGYEVILVNSNPATIMTDPQFGDRTYIEPLVPEVVEAILEKERPDALLPTLGGQTALNVTTKLAEKGVFERLGVELIGASAEAIDRAENRELFKKTMLDHGLDMPRSGWMDIDSYLPYEGKVILHNKQAHTAIVRLPGWLKTGEVKSFVNDQPAAPAAVDRRLVFGGLKAGDTIRLEFPVKVWTEKINIAGEHALTFRGLTLVDIQPRGAKPNTFPIYERAAMMKAGKAPLRQVRRFVADKLIPVP